MSRSKSHLLLGLLATLLIVLLIGTQVFFNKQEISLAMKDAMI